MTTLLGLNGKHISRARDRRMMQRAHRIYNGNMTFLDKLATYPDKIWALMILAGIAFIFLGVGYAVRLLAESAL